VLLIVGIWWWGARRSRQAPGDAQMRESMMGPTIMNPATDMPAEAYRTEERNSVEWGVPPFEPLNIRTAGFDEVAVMDMPMSATAEPVDATNYVEHEIAADPVMPMLEPIPETEVALLPEPEPEPEPAARLEPEPATTTATTPETRMAPAANRPSVECVPADRAPNGSERQRIVTIRVCAVGDQQWSGADLSTILGNYGLAHGRYKVFHRKHSDGRTLFCAASLVEPGTFDPATMPTDQFRGLTLFAVLPGPAEPLETLDTLIATAVDLADALQGVVQDSSGAPLSAQRAEALREDVAQFQLSLR